MKTSLLLLCLFSQVFAFLPLFETPSIEAQDFIGAPISCLSTAMNLIASHKVKQLSDHPDRPGVKPCCLVLKPLDCSCEDSELESYKSLFKVFWGVVNMGGFMVSSGHIAACGVALAAPLLLLYFLLSAEEGNVMIEPVTWFLLLYTTGCIIGNSITKPSIIQDDWDLYEFYSEFKVFKIIFVVMWTVFSMLSTVIVHNYKDVESMIFLGVATAYSWFSLTGSICFVIGLSIRSAISDIRALVGLVSAAGLGITLPGFLTAITACELHARSIQIVIVGLGIFTFSHTVFSFVFMSHWKQLHTLEDYISYWAFPALLLPGVVAISWYDLRNPSRLPQMFFINEDLSRWISKSMDDIGQMTQAFFVEKDGKARKNSIEFGVSTISDPGPRRGESTPMSPSEEKSYEYV